MASSSVTSSVLGSGARYIRSTPASAAESDSGLPRYPVTGVTPSGRFAFDRIGGQCTDVVGAHVDQVIDDAPADVAGGAGHKNGHDFTLRGARDTIADVKAVLWDMDGTLVDSEKVWDISLAALYKELGGELTPEVRASMVGSVCREHHADRLHGSRAGIDPIGDGRSPAG